ncbi:MAG: adenylate/guanylate cyclase domain-containing protein [bacterium]
MKRKFLIPLIISISIAFVISILYYFGLIDGLEHKSYDSRFQIRGGKGVSINENLVKEFNDKDKQFSDNVVIVAVDEESVDKFGRWPWTRNYHRNLIKALNELGARLIVFDVLFVERDKNLPFFDIELAKITEQYSGKIVYASYIEYETVQVVEGTELVNKRESQIKNPYPELDLATMNKGFSNTDPDNDGVLRKAILQLDVNGTTHYSLNAITAALYKKVAPKELIKSLPEKYRKMLLVNYRGNEKTFKSYPFHKIIDPNIPNVFKERWVKDKIVLIGSTTIGTFDHYPTPYSKHFPGVEFHANVIDNLIEGDYMRQIDWIITILIIFIFALLCSMLLPCFSALLGSFIIIGIISLYVLLAYFSFSRFNLSIDVVAPLLSLVFCYVAVLIYRFMTEEKEKRWIKKTFGTFVSPAVIEQMVADPSKLRLGGERKNMSILFSDIRNFTTLSEGLSPENIVEILNEYLTKMTEIVFQTGGTLDKFIGDAVMAFWGAPIAQEDHRKRAVKCAVLMLKELQKLNEKWQKEGKTLLDIGVGINSGDAIVGNMGSIERMDYTVIGDNVNLASRLEGLNKEFKCHIVISEDTYEYVKDMVSAVPLGNVKVKGKEKEVKIYKIDENSDISKLL